MARLIVCAALAFLACSTEGGSPTRVGSSGEGGAAGTAGAMASPSGAQDVPDETGTAGAVAGGSAGSSGAAAGTSGSSVQELRGGSAGVVDSTPPPRGGTPGDDEPEHVCPDEAFDATPAILEWEYDEHGRCFGNSLDEASGAQVVVVPWYGTIPNVSLVNKSPCARVTYVPFDGSPAVCHSGELWDSLWPAAPEQDAWEIRELNYDYLNSWCIRECD